MCYDTTLQETISKETPKTPEIPDCLTRDRLDNEYFPRISRPLLSAVIALCAVFMLTSFNRLNHTDLWGHVNFGRWILEHKSLPTHDPFAAEASSETLVNIPWLSQVGGYLTLQWLGKEGLVLVHALLVTMSCGFAMWAMARRTSLPWAVAGTAAIYILSLPVAGTVRPQLFGMLGMSLTILACTFLPKSKHAVVWLPIAFALWANLHGSFVMGFAVLGIYTLSTTLATCRQSSSLLGGIFQRDTVWMWLTLALCVAATCLNPLGPKLLLAVAGFGSNAALEKISAWRRLPFFSFSGILFWTTAIASIFLIKHSRAKLSLHEIVMLVVFGIATISAIRMLAWWALVWPWVIAPHARSVWNQYMQRGEVEEEEESPMAVVLAIGFVFMTLLISPPTQALLSSQPRGEAAVTSSDTPIYLAEVMERRNLSGRFFAPMDWSDYLVWKNGQRIQPMVYTHVHAIDPATWDDYLHLAAGTSNWLELARKHQLRYLIVTPKRQPELRRAIVIARSSDDPPVRIIYQDQTCMLAEILDQEATTEASSSAE